MSGVFASQPRAWTRWVLTNTPTVVGLRYFLRLKTDIELLFAMNDDVPAVVIAHSMGANVFLYACLPAFPPSQHGVLTSPTALRAFVSCVRQLLHGVDPQRYGAGS